MKMRKQVAVVLALKTITTKVTLRMLAGGAISLLMLLSIYAGEASALPDGSRGYTCSSCHSGRPDQNPPPVLAAIGAKRVNENQRAHVHGHRERSERQRPDLLGGQPAERGDPEPDRHLHLDADLRSGGAITT